MAPHISTITLSNGMPLLVERIPGMRSVAMSWLLPLGSACFTDAEDGCAALLAELMLRGAGGLGSREHSDALDRLGVQRSTNVLTHHVQLGATLLGSRLDEALPLLASMVTAPALPADALDAAKSLAIQSLDGLDDDPQELVMIRLKEAHLAAPFNRHGYGRREAIDAATIESLRSAWTLRARPRGSILAFAGDVEAERVGARLESLLARWTGEAPVPVETAPPRRGTVHIDEETSQSHIALAWTSPPETDPRSMRERLLVRVLGAGSSSRLFSEVREKRGLCYSVFASYSSGRDVGMTSVYAGSTPQRAQQTLDVALAEIERVREGVAPAEFQRAVVGLKSRLVMQGESTGARAASLAGDQFRLGRARTLDEIAGEIDTISHADLQAYAQGRTFAPYTLVWVGHGELKGP
ncbi:MAG: pitrilysin family protein [Phycisphaerales bacterium]